MAEQKQKSEEQKVLEPVKQIEIETKDLVATSRIWIYAIIGLLAYLIFFLLPDINTRMEWMEKDLNSVLVQSERFKKYVKGAFNALMLVCDIYACPFLGGRILE